MTTRVAWITPEYPPDRGGVSDHSHSMVTALRAQGHEVAVWSKPHQKNFQRVGEEIIAFNPEVIVLAYVPLGFAPRTGGISPALVLWWARMRRRLRAFTLLLAHEVSLPVVAHWHRRELTRTLLGSAQLVQFELLAHASNRVVFSNEATRDTLSKLSPLLRRRFDTTRISSSISRAKSLDPRAELAAAGYSVPAKIVLFFGTGHESVLFDYVESALRALLLIEPELCLIIIGMDATKLRARRPALAEFGPHVQALGFVPAHAVSLWLQLAELVLVPLAEGVNARKTTVMAALQHGAAVVATRGVHTREDIAWASMCALSPLDRQQFAATAVRTYQDAAERARLAEAGRAEYEANASVDVTASRLLALATRA